MKRFAYIAAAVLPLLAAGCQKETESPVDVRTREVTLGARMELPSTGDEDTKSVITDEGVFSWSAADKIQVYSDGAVFNTLAISSDPGAASANFSGAIMGTAISKVAVFPANESTAPKLSDNTLTLTLPAEIPWVNGEADNLMVAKGFANGAASIDFKNIGGLIKVTLNNIPATANKVTFLTGKKISGAFSCDISEDKPAIAASVDSDADADGVSFTFAAGTATDMVFYVPVPTGTYSKIAFKVKNGDTVLTEFSGTRENSVTRGKLLIMPPLTLTTISGGGEGGKLSVAIPANYSGTFVLPRTTEDVDVLVNSTPNAVTVSYDGDDASFRPANVYLTLATGADVTDFSLNLPSSHVELAGTGTISSMTSHTSLSTLVVAGTVTLGGMKVTGGSLELSAPVTGAVTVDIPAEAANDSEEKVSIVIKSAIGSLTVTNAATNSVPDKVYVTIADGARVANAVSVPETNCNLHVESGASVETVSTQAKENAIAGSVGTLSAEGENTTVDVYSGAKVDSIDADDSATVNVESDVTRRESEEAPATNDNSGSGTIITGASYAFTVGNKKYQTLTAAIAEADEGDTINILEDIQFDENEVTSTVLGKANDKYNVSIEKSLTLNGNNHTITASSGKRPFALAGVGKHITLRDMTVKVDGGTALWLIADDMTVNLDHTTIDGTNCRESYNQVVTIGSGLTGVTLNVTNSSIQTNSDGSAHYDIIAWSPSVVSVSNSTLRGWSAVYLKADAAGTDITISNSEIVSKGYSGYSNAFGVFVTECGNNSFVLSNNSYNITAQDNYDVLFMFKGNRENTVQLLGTSTTFNTNAPFYGGLSDKWNDLNLNKIYMDAFNKNLFATYYSDNCDLEGPISGGDYDGLYTLSYTPEVYYYWAADGGFTGEYCALAEPFMNQWISNDEFITLQKDVVLKSDITCQLSQYLTEGGSFTMTFGNYSVAKGTYSIKIPTGVSVKTDKQTDIFTAVSDDAFISETHEDGAWIYSAKQTVNYVFEEGVVTVYTAAGLEYVTANYADFRDASHNLTIKLAEDIDMTGKTFTSLNVNNYTSSAKEIVLFTLDGQGHTIKGLTSMLVEKTWAGHSAVLVKDLTIDGASIVKDENDTEENVGVGTIIGNSDSSVSITLTNVKLKNSTVKGGHWTGGLIGYAAGYDNPNDGPQFTTVTVSGCSVTGTTVMGKGSVGALVAHAAGNPAMLWEVSNFESTNNVLNNTNSKTDRTGTLIGTLGDIGRKSQAFPDKTNGIYFTSPLTISGNTVNGSASNRKVGRDAQGKIYLDGTDITTASMTD